ncbi:MAG: DMT family transporter [Clostridia bacterium]|nr:DMT family transporter [Clostridia bacterium]
MILLLSLVTGMIFISTKTLNMLLSKHVGVFQSNVINHVAGLLGVTLMLLLTFHKGSLFTTEVFHIGLFPLLGGFFGATFVALSNYTFSKTKVLISTLLILVGQTIAAVLMDYFIFNEVLSFTSIIGIILIVSAVLLYSKPIQEK